MTTLHINSDALDNSPSLLRTMQENKSPRVTIMVSQQEFDDSSLPAPGAYIVNKTEITIIISNILVDRVFHKYAKLHGFVTL